MLRQLASDQNWEVRAAALEALAAFPKEEDLPLLRELTMDQNWNCDVRAAALETLAGFSKEDVLPLLYELANNPDSHVRTPAIQALASSGRLREELEAFLIQHDQALNSDALAALDELLYMPEWMQRKDAEVEK